MHSNAMPSQLDGQADDGRADESRADDSQAYDNGEAIEGLEGQADGIPEATVARLPIYLRALMAWPNAVSAPWPARNSPRRPG